MHQLSIFANPEPTPAPAKVLKFPQPQPTTESGLEGYREIAKNKSPLVPAKPIVISYELSEPISVGDTVMLRDGTTGTVKKYAYNDKELPAGLKPCQHEGLREIVVTTAVGERCVYAYQLQKIAAHDPETNDAPKPLSLPVGKELKPETKEEPKAKGKVLSMFTTRTRAEKMGKPDPFLSGIKVCTRRLMAPSTADYYQRAFVSGQTVQIYSSGQYAGGIKWADVRLTRAPYQQVLKDIQPEDLVAEGDLWDSKEEFIADLCLGRPDPEAMPWVLWFEVVKMYV